MFYFLVIVLDVAASAWLAGYGVARYGELIQLAGGPFDLGGWCILGAVTFAAHAVMVAYIWDGINRHGSADETPDPWRRGRVRR